VGESGSRVQMCLGLCDLVGNPLGSMQLYQPDTFYVITLTNENIQVFGILQEPRLEVMLLYNWEVWAGLRA